MKPHEFRNQVRKIFKVHLDEEQLVAIVAHFDKDGDGTIDYKEVADLMLHPEKLQDPAKRRRKRPAEHFIVAMNKVREACSENGRKFNIEKVFSKFDADGDGDIRGRNSWTLCKAWAWTSNDTSFTHASSI